MITATIHRPMYMRVTHNTEYSDYKKNIEAINRIYVGNQKIVPTEEDCERYCLSNPYSCDDTYVDLLNRLGQIEDILEKNNIGSLEELDLKLQLNLILQQPRSKDISETEKACLDLIKCGADFKNLSKRINCDPYLFDSLRYERKIFVEGQTHHILPGIHYSEEVNQYIIMDTDGNKFYLSDFGKKWVFL